MGTDNQQVVAVGEPTRPSSARSRILDTADRLFYGEGIRAVGVDRIVSEANVTRVTFYRHFPSKDHLIAAYLHGRLLRDQQQLAQLRRDHPDDPLAVLTGLGAALASDTAAAGFRGCAYANLTAEYCDAEHPAREVAGAHRSWLLTEVRELLVELEVAQPDVVAEQLVMLRAGAMAVASVGSTDRLAGAFAEAWGSLIGQRPAAVS